MMWFQRPFSVPTLVLLSFVLVRTIVYAQAPAYLAEMPTPDRVVQDMKVASQRDSAVRAAVTLNQLAGMAQFLAGAREGRPPTPKEAARIAQYRQRSAAVFTVEEA